MNSARIVLLFFLLSFNLAPAIAQDWNWAIRAGGPGSDGNAFPGVTTDSLGFSYLVGYFNETMTIGDFTLESVGMSDIFIAKVSPGGTCLWAVRAGGPQNDQATKATLDPEGNLLVTGYFRATAQFGSIGIASTGGNDIFTAKFDPVDGTCLWVVKAGGTNSGNEEFGFGIDCDADGNVYVTGVYSGTANFSGTVLTQGGPFVAKYDTDGALLWAAQATNANLENSSYGIRVESDGTAYITGFFVGVGVTFGEDLLVGLGNPDIFIAKISSEGQWLWARAVGAGNQTDVGYAITTDADGNVYVAGSYMASGLFGGMEPPGFPSVPFSTSNPFLVKYTSDGDFLWVHTMPATLGATPNSQAHALDFSPQTNQLTMAGHFIGTTNFGNGITLQSSGSGDVFVARFDTSGTCQWATKAGSTQWISARSIGRDANEQLYIAGWIQGNATFGDTTISSAGSHDVFLAKMGVDFCLPNSVEVEAEACDFFLLNEQAYDSTGTYVQILTNAFGCDSTVTLHLTIIGLTDQCGICIPDGPDNPDWNQSCSDCAGILNGWAYEDSCGNCVGGSTGLSPCEAPCQADLNQDGIIGFADLNMLLSEGGCSADCMYDLNGDGMVGFQDFAILLASFGMVCP